MEPKVALITGGARGIGRGIALDLAAQGWAIAICYRTSERDAEATTKAVIERGGQGIAVRSDVSDPKACHELAKRVEEKWTKIDALINAAGPYHRVNLFEETPKGWDDTFTNNLHPVFYLGQAVAPGMKTRKYGRIISFSMANADKMEAQPMVTAHYIAKVGILVLTRTLAKTLAADGITVNAISPGFIDSGSAPPGELDRVVKNVPAGYIGDVKDTLSAVRYLLSDEARYVTGANVHVSGGWGL